MDNNDLSHLSPQEIIQLAMYGKSQLKQAEASQQAFPTAPIHPNYSMPPPTQPMPQYQYSNFMPGGQGQVHGDGQSDVGGSATSSQPTHGSPRRDLNAPTIDIEETSPLKEHPSMAGLQDTSNSKVNNKKKGKQENYQALEDRLLVTCWLDISCDPMTNTGQNFDAFWDKIVTLYNSKRGSYPARTKRSLQSRYDVIKRQVAKFSGYYADVVRRNPSGMTDADKTTMACTEFVSSEAGHKPFKFMHCWELMKDNPKYQDSKHGRNYRANQGNPFEDQLMQAQPEEIAAGDTCPTPTSTAGKRPMGRDAAKRAAKKQQSASASTGGSDFAASMHDLMVTRLADSDNSRKTRQEAFMEWKKEEKEDARQDRKVLIEIEKEKLKLEQQKITMRAEMIAAENRRLAVLQKQEDERILAMKLDEMEEPRKSYYAELQKQILAKVRSTPDY